MSGELPKRITDRLASSQSDILCCYCGAFPQIRRAWATLDQTLFLWRFDRVGCRGAFLSRVSCVQLP
eukprot:scaffold1072_cov356-Prasinococcus_capsulatus_cf.AAC.11